MHRLQFEPVALASFIRVCLIAGMSFGLSLTDAQFVAVMAAVEAGLALFTRSIVAPNAVVDAALRLPAGATASDAKHLAVQEAKR